MNTTTTTATATDIRRAQAAYTDASHAITEALDAVAEAVGLMREMNRAGAVWELRQVADALNSALGQMGDAEAAAFLSA